MRQVTLDKFSAWVIDALKFYIDSQPDHNNGLCWWLTDKAPNQDNWDGKGCPYGAQTYEMMCAARRVEGCPEFETYDMITEEGGYNERRAELAQFVIDALLNRELRPVMEMDESRVIEWIPRNTEKQ